jgi:mRNA export factor
VLATAGSDGSYSVWDVRARHRLRSFPKAAGPITSAAFNRDGMALAHAVGYDWSKGYAHHNPAADKKIIMHCFAEPLK